MYNNFQFLLKFNRERKETRDGGGVPKEVKIIDVLQQSAKLEIVLF